MYTPYSRSYPVQNRAFTAIIRLSVRNFPEADRTKQGYYGPVIMKAMSQRSDSFFRSALWIIAISWITIVILVFAFYFSVLLLNFLFHH